jgi:hypothetical protein
VLRWAGGAAAVALLAAGGTLAGLKLSGSPAAVNGAQAVALNHALSSPASGSAGCAPAAGSTPAGGRASAAHCRRLRLMRLVKGMYGQVAFHSPSGTIMFAFERGKVTSASGGHLVVRAASGTTWTWNLASGTVIRSYRRALPSSALAAGARVFVAGQVSGAARDAGLVFVRPSAGGGAPNAPAQSGARSSPA